MKREPIPVSGPWITDLERSLVADAVSTGWYETANVYPQKFEAAFASFCGRTYAISLPSCTAGIHLALAALGVGPGDEVILPDVTWIASAAPVDYVGATPVFADIDEETWCITAEAIEDAITPRTRAIIAVDLYGGMPEWDKVLGVAERHGIPVIEDAAEAVGSKYEGVPAGKFGIASVFSFHGSKTVTTGEGGMLVTDDPELYERCSRLRDHGRKPGDTMFLNEEIGFKYKMSALQAALGLGQIQRVDELVEKKRAIFGWYASRLKARPFVRLNAEPAGTFNSYWMVTTIVDPRLELPKNILIDHLSASGISTRPFFTPLSAIPAYGHSPAARIAAEKNVVSYAVSPWGINLPSALNLTETMVDRVCETFCSRLESAQRAFA